MERDKCEAIITEIIDFNIETFTLKLSDNRKIHVDLTKYSVGFTGGYVWIGRNGVKTTVDYRVIESICFYD